MQAQGTVARPRPYFSGGRWSEPCQLRLSPRRQIKNNKCSSILFLFSSPSLSPPPFFFILSFFPFFFFVNARIQGHCQKHIPHNQTSDGDSFPTACVSENSEIIPMFQRQVPWCSSRGQPGSGPCSLLFVPAFAEFLALDTIQPAFSIVCHVTYGSSAPNVCMYPENAAFHYVFSM